VSHPQAAPNRCFYCDKALSRKTKTKDHVQPKSRNGSPTSKRNIVDACHPCNTLKGCLTLEEFRVVMAYRAGYISRAKMRFPGENRRKWTED
jgi:hypothetical protein